jgi:hypothetical protein
MEAVLAMVSEVDALLLQLADEPAVLKLIPAWPHSR